MQIELASIETNQLRFAHTYEPGAFSLDDERLELVEPPVILGEIKREGQKLMVEGSVKASVKVDCDRCLQPVILPLAARFQLEYVSRDYYEKLPAAELSTEDLELSVLDSELVDLDEITREQLLLLVPSQVLCQPDCKGICPTCGANRNLSGCSCEEQVVDPRWAALKSLVGRE
jgi:uncharacterized protein